MIEIRGRTNSYDGFRAVNGLSFQVQEGEILGLVGPNGAGKTTAMRCMSGIIPPTHGRLLIGGIDLQEDPVAAKKQQARVSDEPHLFEKWLSELTIQVSGAVDSPVDFIDHTRQPRCLWRRVLPCVGLVPSHRGVHASGHEELL